MAGRTGIGRLGRFRERLRGCFERRADALFELCDAVLTGGAFTSPVQLSLAPVHRRGWGSLYAALSKGGIDAEALRYLLAQHPLAGSESAGVPQVYAVDQSAWPRNDAEAGPGRGYHYHPSRHSAGQPIVAGWSYQLVAELGFERDSWVAPVDARRVSPLDNANDAAAEQIKALASRLASQDVGSSKTPLFVFDAGYDPVRLQRNLESCAAQILVRLHSGRTFYADPPTLERRPVGRPFVHGKKFDLKDPDTWHQPSTEHTSENTDYGKVRVRAWSRHVPRERFGAWKTIYGRYNERRKDGRWQRVLEALRFGESSAVAAEVSL